MTLEIQEEAFSSAEWLFAIGDSERLPAVDGLVSVADYDPRGRPPDEAAVMEKAASYGARAVFFEAARHGRSSVPQAFIFDAKRNADDERFAELHKRLWSWGGVPLLYRAGPGLVQLFRCAHEPDFAGPQDVPVCNPIRTLSLGAEIAARDVWWDAERIRNGAIWDDPEACRLLLSAHKSAHRSLVEAVRHLAKLLGSSKLLNARLRRRLLILSLLIAYLEERLVLLPQDFDRVLAGAKRFFEVLGDGTALATLLEDLEERFNGHVFRLSEADKAALIASPELSNYARLIQGYEDPNGQLSLWRLYSFRDLPVELISNIYQLFVSDTASSVYTPPALVRLILDEALSWDRIDQLMAGDSVILDPACGSGVFLVEAYKRLVLHWRSRNDWARPGVDELRLLLQRVHGIDLEEGAVELAAFSLCLSLCDALEPEEIRASIKLFPPLAGETLHWSCFFDAKRDGLVKPSVGVVVGNPPFASKLTTEGAVRSYEAYSKTNGRLADKQLAYLFLHEAMDVLEPGGVLAMVEPSGFLYNQNALSFRHSFFERWKVRELLDFVSVRGLFKKGHADPKIVIVLAEAAKAKADDRLLHAVFRRNGRAAAEQGFDIDYYDLHWVTNAEAECSRDVWRANLLGGARVRSFLERLRKFPTLRDHARRHGWDAGEGYIVGEKNASENVGHLVGAPRLPTNALGPNGIDTSRIDVVPDEPIKDPKTERRFLGPALLIKEHQDLYSDVSRSEYMAYQNEIVGLSAPNDLKGLEAADRWLHEERDVLRAYIAGVSPRLYTQRATAVLSADIFALPFPENGDLDVSDNERIIAEDVVDFQREFIRLGTRATVMQKAPSEALQAFDQVLIAQINTVYARKPLKALQSQAWSGAICRAYAFGDGEVDWTGADALRNRLDALLAEKRGNSVSVTRIARIYDRNFLFLLKPDRHRFWTRSVALRDADDVLADLRTQGF